MNKAVAAKLENPRLSLLEALIIGGFKFQDPRTGTKVKDAANAGRAEASNANGKKRVKFSDRVVYDSDNILLSQRKNQLSRRIRFFRRRPQERKKEDEPSFTPNRHNNHTISEENIIMSALLQGKNHATQQQGYTSQNLCAEQIRTHRGLLNASSNEDGTNTSCLNKSSSLVHRPLTETSQLRQLSIIMATLKQQQEEELLRLQQMSSSGAGKTQATSCAFFPINQEQHQLQEEK